ncbi:MAG: divalent-cation tolerance protein CutA [Candidatus Thorarchaeota archaeon]|jgi:periplasmic divalent cation tolerance protein
MTEYILAITTCPNSDATALAKRLVEARVCACVNIVPSIRSIYRWKGKVVDDEESILFIKTERTFQESLWNELRAHHSYDVPEFISIPIQGGSQDYLKWITENITGRL